MQHGRARRTPSQFICHCRRSAAIKSACANEESTKQFLILPVIGALGYDYTDPLVVQPELLPISAREYPSASITLSCATAIPSSR